MGSDRRPNDGAWQGGRPRGQKEGTGVGEGVLRRRRAWGLRKNPVRTRMVPNTSSPTPGTETPRQGAGRSSGASRGGGGDTHCGSPPSGRTASPATTREGEVAAWRGLWWGPRRVWVWGKLREATRQGKQEAATGPQPEGPSGHGADTGRCWALGADPCRPLGAHRLALPGLSPLL